MSTTPSVIEHYLIAYFDVTPEEASVMATFFHSEKLPRGQFFIQTGQRADRLGILRSGLTREFIYGAEGEITKWIGSTGQFVVDIASFVFSKPARWNVVALTNVELYVISAHDYSQLGTHVARWPEIEKAFLVKCFAVLEERLMQHLSMSAEERYLTFFAQNKELFQEVPLHYIASLLGMTPETMSRIRHRQARQSS